MPDRERVKTLLDEALARPAPERMVFVRGASGSDSRLCDEVVASPLATC